MIIHEVWILNLRIIDILEFLHEFTVLFLISLQIINVDDIVDFQVLEKFPKIILHNIFPLRIDQIVPHWYLIWICTIASCGVDFDEFGQIGNQLGSVLLWNLLSLHQHDILISVIIDLLLVFLLEILYVYLVDWFFILNLVWHLKLVIWFVDAMEGSGIHHGISWSRMKSRTVHVRRLVI